MVIFNRKNILKYNLLAAIALSLIAISSACADINAPDKKLLPDQKSKVINAGNPIAASICCNSGLATTPGFESISAQSAGLAIGISSSMTSSLAVNAGFQAAIQPPVGANIVFQQNALQASANISAATANHNFSPTIQPPPTTEAQKPTPSANEKPHWMSTQVNRTNLSCDAASKTILFSTPGGKQATNNQALFTDKSAKLCSDNKANPNFTREAELTGSGIFVSLAKQVSNSGMSLIKHSNAFAATTASTIIGFTKPMTTKSIKMLAELGNRINRLSTRSTNGIIPPLKTVTANNPDPELIVPAESKKHNNDQSPVLPPVRSTTTGKGNNNIQPFSDTVSRYVSNQPNPINSVNSFIIRILAVNYSKTGLSPPAIKANFILSSLPSKSNTIFLSIPLSLNRIDGFNCKGFSIYTNLFNYGGQQ